jgi:cytidyltransferase-like protein
MIEDYNLPIGEIEDVARRIRGWRAEGLRVVLCHGRFDPLHIGHLYHFADARAHGDRLVVTVTPDAHAAVVEGRPIFSEAHRVAMVAGLRVVDFAAVNRWATAEETLAALRPDVFAKGVDYAGAAPGPGFARETALAGSLGIEVLVTATPKFSSTELIRAAALLHGGGAAKSAAATA